MFQDEIVIYVKAGNGGRGCVSFHREKYQPKGGPDGGNGGQGGDIIIHANPHLNTLFHLIHQRKLIAQNGQPGRGNNCTGKNGRASILPVPPGTIIRRVNYEQVLKDLKKPDERIIIVHGGRGGRGNRTFATSTHQTPRHAGPGEPGEEKWLHLELKLIADVGLVGLPNAGKSFLLRRLTSARPKVADYPFTTLEPCLGIIKGPDYRTRVIADLPGLIEGAHQGKGLGDKFLKHIERTRMIAHIIDFASATPPKKAYQTIRKELSRYSKVLSRKPEIIIANKMDLPKASQNWQDYGKAFTRRIIPISAVTKLGLDKLHRALFRILS